MSRLCAVRYEPWIVVSIDNSKGIIAFISERISVATKFDVDIEQNIDSSIFRDGEISRYEIPLTRDVCRFIRADLHP